jgi:UDP-GlcNAc:undecaprenyl-phosphate GlcNAc-1-phosphate transferase
VVGGWAFANAFLAMVLISTGRANWRAHLERKPSVLARLAGSGYKQHLYTASLLLLRTGVYLLFFIGPVLVRDVDPEVGLAALVLAMLLLLRLVFGNRLWFVNLRLILYVTVAFVVYLIDHWLASIDTSLLVYEYIYIGIISVALVIGSRHRIDDAFRTTPTDYLIVLLIFGSMLIPQVYDVTAGVVPLAVKLVIMFYSVEVLLHQMKGRWAVMPLAAFWALCLIAVKWLGFA